MKKIIIFIFLLFENILFAPMSDLIQQQIEQQYATLTTFERGFIVGKYKKYCEGWSENIQSVENYFEHNIRPAISVENYEALRDTFNLIKNQARLFLSSSDLYTRARCGIDNGENSESMQMACKDILRKVYGSGLSFELIFSNLDNWKQLCLLTKHIENIGR